MLFCYKTQRSIFKTYRHKDCRIKAHLSKQHNKNAALLNRRQNSKTTTYYSPTVNLSIQNTQVGYIQVHSAILQKHCAHLQIHNAFLAVPFTFYLLLFIFLYRTFCHDFIASVSKCHYKSLDIAELQGIFVPLILSRKTLKSS